MEGKKEKLENVILYVIYNLGGRLESRTKLVKLLYFIDKKAQEELKSKITGVRYIYHYYGPYSPDIINAVHELEEEGKLIEEYDPLYGMYRYYLAENIDDENDIKLSEEERGIIDKVLKDYGGMNAKKLKERAYEYLSDKKPGDIVL